MSTLRQRLCILLANAVARILRSISERIGPDIPGSAAETGIRQNPRLATGNRDLVDKLLGAGANGGAGWRGCDGKTLLHAAAEGGNVPVIARLRRAGAGGDMKAKTLDTGHTPLDLAVVGGKAAAAEALIMAGADVNVLDSKNDGPLHLAIKGGHVRIAKDLLLSGVNPVQARSSGNFPIHLAAWHGLDEVVLALVEKGIDLNCLNYKRGTPLHVAKIRSAPEQRAAIRALFEAGADIEGPGIRGRTPLRHAARSGSYAAILTLLQLGANVNSKDDVGKNPLHCACFFCHHDAADLLLRWGADETAVNLEGETVVSMVIRRIAEALETRCPPLERVSKLLARAPQDRAWRRRGFLVLCRAHRDRVRLAVEIPVAAAEATEGPQQRPRCCARTGRWRSGWRWMGHMEAVVEQARVGVAYAPGLELCGKAPSVGSMVCRPG
ncbi:ankyrin repeat domain protein [Ectocarpus siliculosus]|uniref:Ankyrin repeat domain protein n=1 Tax=Ectocarpus siliculosus TaxID=2880 RepID=D7G292_ECTSI|nr:ankyrin repeat domain protein [Ectocarpus siliculosus]|eukprot:CBJ48769.1 ankyrin repeat domain protein [Ectocarpus siliculosus]